MCRHNGFNFNKVSWVCIPCRHVGRFLPFVTLTPRCPSCRADLVNLGHDFHVPRKRDDAAWAAVAIVVARGERYDSCGCTGPGYRPRTKAQARQDATERPWPKPNRKGRSRG